MWLFLEAKTPADLIVKIWIIISKRDGLSRDGVFKAFNEIWLIDIKYIKENTPLQFVGCKGKRPKKY